MLAKSKLNSIETLVSQALIDMEISHEVNTIMKEKKNENMNENVKIFSKKQENMRLNSVNSNLYFFSINKNEYISYIHCRSMEKKSC